jgi:pimeloyl-ACP methyl ester carboxylesterase
MKRHAFGATLVTALLATPGCFLTPLYSEDLPKSAEPHSARTDDGWEVALVRYRPIGVSTGRPVLLCHGITGNGRHMDLDDAHSIARWFARRGREAWTLSLRDGGGSDTADASKGRPRTYTVDTYAMQDLKAAIAEVRAVTGAESVDYVGHSLGGIILYIYLGRGGGGIHAAATLGSPVRFHSFGRGAEIVRSLVEPLTRPIDTWPVADLAHVIMPLHGEIRGPVEGMLYNPANTQTSTWKKLIAVGEGTISGGVMRQAMRWFQRDSFDSADGTVDYAVSMSSIRVPILVVAGKIDRMGEPWLVKTGYRRLGGPKEFFLAGTENGAVADYGHMDLILGDRAGEEVWSRVAEFLDRFAD